MTNARTSYRENDVRGATRVRLVVLLYEQLLQDLRRAQQAVDQNDIELRTKCINHAILVIAHLQSPLDFANGGKVANDLDHFYNALRQNLVQVQFYPSRKSIGQEIADLLEVREAWIEVDRAETLSAAVMSGSSLSPTVTTNQATSTGTGYGGAADSEPQHERIDWQG